MYEEGDVVFMGYTLAAGGKLKRDVPDDSLVCKYCGHHFPNEDTINLTEGHFQEKHPGKTIAFTLVKN